MRTWPTILTIVATGLTLIAALPSQAQNSMVGDGFGGRLWYRPTNYMVGSYSAFSLCYSDPCDSSSNQLYGWGSDWNGELGDGIWGNCSVAPVAIPGMSDVRYYSTGYWTGAIKNDGTGWIWHFQAFPMPTQVISDVKFLDASAQSVSYVKNDGTVWSIGWNGYGAFGNGTTTSDSSAVTQMAGVTNAVRVAVGQYATYVLLDDGHVQAVGASTFGLLGDPAVLDPYITSAITVPGLIDIVDIKANSWAAAALDGSGDVYCWGTPAYTGNGGWMNDTVPERIEALSDIVAISGCQDGQHFLALDAFGNCYAWGDLNLGSVFWGAPILTEPVLIATNVVDIMAGELFSYIVKADGSLWAAGLSNGCSIWLDQPNYGSTNPQPDLLLLDPSAVPGACSIVGTVAVPSSNCDGTSTITVSHFGGQAPYLYDIGNGPQGSNVFNGLDAGTFTVTVTDAGGCVTTTTCTTDPGSAQPILDLLDDVLICSGESYTLPWGPIVTTTGTYTDTVPSVSGCDTVRVLSLTVAPYAHAFLTDTVCDFGPYVLPSGDTVAYSPFEIRDTLQYTNACDTVYHVHLYYGGASIALLVSDTITEPGTPVTLTASSWNTNLTYSWSPPDGLDCLDCQSVVASPLVTTTYCVSAAFTAFCPDTTACVTVVVTALPTPSPDCTPSAIFIPNAFSPNASGSNDQQCVLGADCIASMLFSIYDRWGNKVFESTDPNACWDGTYNGQALDPAVFVYHLSATLTNSEVVEKQGNITLVR